MNNNFCEDGDLRDGTVAGTDGRDLIDFNYTGDPEGDLVDHNDAILPGAGPNDDLIVAMGGDDIASAGDGNDEVYGGDGNDVLAGGGGNDTIFGDAGDDFLKGHEGDDILDGGADSDTLSGGDGRDTLIVGLGDVSADGGAGGDDLDVLDLRGNPPYRIDDLTPDSNGNGFNGTVVYLDADGNPTGETLPFTEIEEFLEDSIAPPPPVGEPDGTVEGTSGDDLIDLGYAGDPEGDLIDNDDALLTGFSGNDDLVYAFGGSDTVYALDGEDEVYGGSGNDLIYGGDGVDSLVGNTGNDTIYGDAGNDNIRDGIGSDVIAGGDGDDTIRLGDDPDGVTFDTVFGGTGNDTIYGGSGNDVIDSSDGAIGLFDNPYPPLPTDPNPFDDRDSVDGGRGDDTIRTGDDADVIQGGDGNDTIDAGIDDDTVNGGTGNDTIIGGEGNDSISGNAGDDLIYGGLGPVFPDSLNIPDVDGDLVPDNGLDTIYGGAGNDTIFGLDDDDSIYGGGGNDTIDAGVDDDLVDGGQGDDTINGGQGADILLGSNDRDTFVVGSASHGAGDAVFGGSGGDDFDSLNLSGAGPFRIVGTTTDSDGNGINGTIEFLDGDGNVTGNLTFENIEQVIPCFTPGTLIATPRGERLVEELKVGDRIITRDNGIQEIRWTGHKEITGKALVNAPHLKPVLIKAGALGNGLPERDMLLSPNHRVLVANERTQLYFEENEVLAAAKHLVGTPGIHEVDVMGTTYIHFMFDRHEVVLSNGAWTESFQPGDYSLKGIGNAQRTEILELFPELKTQGGLDGYQAARKSLKKHEALLLVR